MIKTKEFKLKDAESYQDKAIVIILKDTLEMFYSSLKINARDDDNINIRNYYDIYFNTIIAFAGFAMEKLMFEAPIDLDDVKLLKERSIKCFDRYLNDGLERLEKGERHANKKRKHASSNKK